jgi:hypothetical protein
MRDLIDKRADALYLTGIFCGHQLITPGHVLLPRFTCGQVMLPEYPPSIYLTPQNKPKYGHFMLPAPAIL